MLVLHSSKLCSKSSLFSVLACSTTTNLSHTTTTTSAASKNTASNLTHRTHLSPRRSFVSNPTKTTTSCIPFLANRRLPNSQLQKYLFSTPATSSTSSSTLGKYNQHPKKWRDPIARISDWDEINRDSRTNPSSSSSSSSSISSSSFPSSPSSLDAIETREERQKRLSDQAARCMDCGTPFCHTSYSGCPLNNLIPEWNALVHTNDSTSWGQALQRLQLTNNFPEFTGRVCPAPCEGACVAGIPVNDLPVSIKDIEYNIIDYGFENGLVQPRILSDEHRNGLEVAVIGSGPAGLACADNLNQAGYKVTVYEREDAIGGLLTYGIPNMKLDKKKVQRRVDLLEKEGIKFVTNRHVKSIEKDLDKPSYDAYVLAIGSTVARDLPAPGRDLEGIHFAMEFLTSNQKKLFVSTQGTVHSAWDESYFIDAKDKKVVVIGGGDTGTDCIGTSMRQHCQSITNLELMDKPPDARDELKNPWPEWPRVFRIDYGHEEAKHKFGQDPRKYKMSVKEFVSDGKNRVKALKAVEVDFVFNESEGRMQMKEVAGSEIEIEADLVLLAMGFVAPEGDIINDLELEMKGNKGDANYLTNRENVFVTGDCRRGQSLVVWAITEGRGAATAVDKYFKNREKEMQN